MTEDETRTFQVEGASGVSGPWTLQLSADRMTFASADRRESHFVLRSDVPEAINIASALGSHYLHAKVPKAISFRVTQEVVDHFLRWRGPLTDADLRVALKRRMSWSMPIAALWVFSALPIQGDPEAGIEAVPLDPIGVGLGASLFVLALVSRLRPHPNLFLFDAAWLAALAADVCVDVARRGDSKLWLLLLPIIYWSARDAYQHYARFRP